MEYRFNIGDTVYVLEDNDIKAVEVLTIYIDKEGLTYYTSNTHHYFEEQLYASPEELIKNLIEKYSSLEKLCYKNKEIEPIFTSDDYTFPLRLFFFVSKTNFTESNLIKEKNYLLEFSKRLLM